MSYVSFLPEAASLLEVCGVIDCHCDTITRFLNSPHDGYSFNQRNNSGHIDLPRLEEGRVKVQFFAICVPRIFESLKKTLKYIELYHSNIESSQGRIGHVDNLSDLERITSGGSIAGLLCLEGGEALEGDIIFLHLMYRLGVRCMSLTWNHRNQLADGINEESSMGGLTRKGKEVIKTMESLGMLLDLSHLSSRGFQSAMEEISKPPVVSHANAYALCPHPRNLSNLQLKQLAGKGGMIGLSFYPTFISNENKEVGLEDLLDHFVHIASVIGVEHIGIGSDFDGIPATVQELHDCSRHLQLVAGLLQRGFSSREVELMASGNAMRILKQTIK